jgi:hypothetical protein
MEHDGHMKRVELVILGEGRRSRSCARNVSKVKLTRESELHKKESAVFCCLQKLWDSLYDIMQGVLGRTNRIISFLTTCIEKIGFTQKDTQREMLFHYHYLPFIQIRKLSL